MKSGAALLIFILLCSCGRKDDTATVFTLPPVTQTGANTFGFVLSGKVWRNNGQICSQSMGGCRENLEGQYFKSDGGLNVRADRVLYNDGIANNAAIVIDLYTHLEGARSYSTLAGDDMDVSYSPDDNEPGYLLSNVNPRFTVNLTRLDTVNGIISGEFYGTLFRKVSPNGQTTSSSDSLKITEGRFDLKYKE